MIGDLHCCAFCGECSFGGPRISKLKFLKVPPVTMPMCPAALQSPHLDRFMEVSSSNADIAQTPDPEPLGEAANSSTLHWLACHHCKSIKKRLQRMRHNVLMTPPYLKAVLEADPMACQSLSLLNVAVNFERRFQSSAFSKGTLAPQHALFSNPLVVRGGGSSSLKLSNDLLEVSSVLKVNNAWVRKYKMLAEWDRPTHGLPLIPESAIGHITSEVAARDPMGCGENMSKDFVPRTMELVAAMDLDLQGLVNTLKSSEAGPKLKRFQAGNLVSRSTNQQMTLETTSEGLLLDMVLEPPAATTGELHHLMLRVLLMIAAFKALFLKPCLLPCFKGALLCPAHSPGVDVLTAEAGPSSVSRASLPLALPRDETDSSLVISLELALFTVLFPHGRGGYTADGIYTSFAGYLRHRMLCSFSAFTLYKPYLMLCFLVRQFDMLVRNCGQNILEKDIKTYKKKHPGCSNEDTIRNTIKFSIPGTMPGEKRNSVRVALFLVPYSAFFIPSVVASDL